jgi:hypothetical protein
MEYEPGIGSGCRRSDRKEGLCRTHSPKFSRNQPISVQLSEGKLIIFCDTQFCSSLKLDRPLSHVAFSGPTRRAPAVRARHPRATSKHHPRQQLKHCREASGPYGQGDDAHALGSPQIASQCLWYRRAAGSASSNPNGSGGCVESRLAVFASFGSSAAGCAPRPRAANVVQDTSEQGPFAKSKSTDEYPAPQRQFLPVSERRLAASRRSGRSNR